MRTRRRPRKTVIKELREKRDNCALHWGMRVQKQHEKEMQKKFLSWWDCWIEPLIKELEPL